MYLAHKGYKVANVPLVKGIAPAGGAVPDRPEKIVALIIDPKRLVEIRTSRLITMGQSTRGSYADYQQVEDELAYCKQLYRRHPEWMVINVTNKSVEEAASDIMRRMDSLAIE